MEPAVGDARLGGHFGRVRALVRDADQPFGELECRHDLGGGRQQRDHANWMLHALFVSPVGNDFQIRVSKALVWRLRN